MTRARQEYERNTGLPLEDTMISAFYALRRHERDPQLYGHALVPSTVPEPASDEGSDWRFLARGDDPLGELLDALEQQHD